MITRFYLYPLRLRVWHWANALTVMVLIATGISMHFSDVDNLLLSFRTATYIHNIAGIVLTALWLLFALITFISGDEKRPEILIPAVYEKDHKKGGNGCTGHGQQDIPKETQWTAAIDTNRFT